MAPALTLLPIGTIHTPFHERVSAPRQPYAAAGIEGTIELFPGRDFEHALSDLEGWDYLWVIFWFHLNEGWRPKVLPPRSPKKRRGVFSTRSPHRPNPIGLSVVRLEAVEGLRLRVRDVDMVDGTPVLDIKPYVPFADSKPDARTGWLEPPSADGLRAQGSAPRDPDPGFDVVVSDVAFAQAGWLNESHDIDLLPRITTALKLGPQPHPYRRIRQEGSEWVLSVKDWRVRFQVAGRRVTVLSIATGYKESQLRNSLNPSLEPALLAHRAYVSKFGFSRDSNSTSGPDD